MKPILGKSNLHANVLLLIFRDFPVKNSSAWRLGWCHSSWPPVFFVLGVGRKRSWIPIFIMALVVVARMPKCFGLGYYPCTMARCWSFRRICNMRRPILGIKLEAKIYGDFSRDFCLFFYAWSLFPKVIMYEVWVAFFFLNHDPFFFGEGFTPDLETKPVRDLPWKFMGLGQTVRLPFWGFKGLYLRAKWLLGFKKVYWMRWVWRELNTWMIPGSWL